MPRHFLFAVGPFFIIDDEYRPGKESRKPTDGDRIGQYGVHVWFRRGPSTQTGCSPLDIGEFGHSDRVLVLVFFVRQLVRHIPERQYDRAELDTAEPHFNLQPALLRRFSFFSSFFFYFFITSIKVDTGVTGF